MTAEADEDLSPHQQLVLSDGSVTHDEMRASLNRVVDCVEKAGYGALDIEFRPRIGWEVTAGPYPTEAEAGAADTAIEECTRIFLSQVATQYLDEHALSEQEEAHIADMVARCLSEEGIAATGESDPPSTLARPNNAAEQKCIDAAIDTVVSDGG